MKNETSERGAALVVVIVVTAILTVLGLSMVAFSEIEERTASTHRDEVQVQALADAGVRVVQQMFRNPTGPLVPQNGTTPPESAAMLDFTNQTTLDNIGVFRTTRGLIASRYDGTTSTFFQGPFRDSFQRVFAGVYNPTTSTDVYDIRFTCTNPNTGTPIASANCWLDTRVNSLLTTATNFNENFGRITEISLYRPPVLIPSTWAPGDPGRMLGYATVRVTASKFDSAGRTIASETVQAIIGDMQRRPSIMANGNLEMESSSGFCGSDCEQIHANGNILIESGVEATGGTPVLTSTGTVTNNGGTITPAPLASQPFIPPPPINPWADTYRPKTSEGGIDKYYLFTNRTLDAVWTDNIDANNPADVSCLNEKCNSYSLTGKARNANGCIYKWQQTPVRKWILQGTCKGGGNSFDAPFDAWKYYGGADSVVAGTGDTAAAPFERLRLPNTFFQLDSSFQPSAVSPLQGVILLFDGGVHVKGSLGGSQKASNQPPPPWNGSLIATGTIYLESSANMNPALANRVMLLSGRDVWILGSFNNDYDGVFCSAANNPVGPAPPSSTDMSAAVIASHEQLSVDSSAKVIGILVAENDTNMDNNRDVNSWKSPDMTTLAMFIDSSASHGYKCDMPPWPFPQTGQAMILAAGDAVQ